MIVRYNNTKVPDRKIFMRNNKIDYLCNRFDAIRKKNELSKSKTIKTPKRSFSFNFEDIFFLKTLNLKNI